MLVLAQIIKPQGIKGDVKVMMFADADFDMRKIGEVFVDGKKTIVENAYRVAGTWALKLDIIKDVNMANEFRGKKIMIEKNQIKLQKNQFLVADLIEKPVFLQSGAKIGVIFDVENFGSADVIYIKAEKEILCSHIEGLIESVDAQKVVFNDKIFAEVAVYED